MKEKSTLETDPLLLSSSGEILTNEVTRKKIGKAAFLIRDVILEGGAVDASWTYNPYDQEHSKLSKKVSMFCRIVMSNTLVYSATHLVAWILILLSFIEDPEWCRNLEGGCDNVLTMRGVPAVGKDYDLDVQYYPNFGMNWLNPYQSHCVEWSCVIVLLIYVVLLIGRDGLEFSTFIHSSDGLRIYRLFFIISVLSLLFGLTGEYVLGLHRPFALYVRLIIFITLNDNIQRELEYVVKILPKIVNILFILLLTVVFYAWIGNAAFFGTREGSVHFPSLIEGMFTLWICVTTANYPDVMMLAYNENKATSIYFISFMIIAFYFIMNVILATVVNSYNESESTFQQKQTDRTKSNMNEAYQLLDEDGKGWIGKKTVMDVFLVLNEECPEIRHVNKDDAEILFGLLDKDGSYTISKEEFMYFSGLMLFEFKCYTSKPILIEKYSPATFHSYGFQKFRAFITSEVFEGIIDILIFLNAIIVFIQSYPELAGESTGQDIHITDGELDTVWEKAETFFTVIYCFEMALKLLVLGWRRYTQANRNIFDGTITILALTSTIYVYYPNDFSNSLLIRYVVMSRVLRLLRLLIAIPQFQVTGRIFTDLSPVASRVFLLLMVIMYVFSAIGMQSFGGLVTRDPNNQISYRLKDTDFADNEYWGNSFNDMLSGMNVLFNLLVVNNWPEEADGILAVSGTRLSRYFFVVFHIFGVIIVNNVVVAYVVDAFMSEFEKSKNSSKEMKRVVSKRHITQSVFDAREISGTKTSLKGQFVVKMKSVGKKQARRESLFRAIFDSDVNKSELMVGIDEL